MDALLTSFYADPLQYIGLVFASLSGIATIFFIVGFFAGLPHFFTQSSNDEHQEHHRHRITWGMMALLYIFIVWECVKIVASWFGYTAPPNIHVFSTFVLTMIIFVVVLWVMFKIKDRVVSGGH